MKFSVLLPTRNRLEYLRYAVESVRRQSYGDWEIVISDNDSEDDICGYVASLGDDRLRYCRTASFVPVTENWNNALDRAVGDWVVMLGDDDGLLPGYFDRLREALTQNPDPDFIYSSALFFAYPGVMPDRPEGFIRRDVNKYFFGTAPYMLDRTEAHAIAQGYLDFRMPVASNMQFAAISRRAIDRLRSKAGQFFCSPYPDFYATPALFLTSARILIIPEPLVVIGITPKSYGYFHFNNKADTGLSFLNNAAALDSDDRISTARLPGTSYNDSWLAANCDLYQFWGREYGLRFDIGRYRWRQIIYSYKHRYFDRDLSGVGIGELSRRLTWPERLAAWAMAVGFSVLRRIPRRLRDGTIARLRGAIGQHAISEREPTQRRFRNLLELYDAVEADPAGILV